MDRSFLRPLTALAIAMAVLALLTLAGLALDARVITGAPAWLKPFKFAVSIAIYAASVAWVLQHVEGRPAFVRRVATITAAALWIEIALIVLQAARGTTSHFNVATPFDAAVFRVMGFAILVLWVLQLLVAIALFRQRFVDESLGWALRLGMALTFAGAGIGWLMVVPSAAQRAAMATGAFVAVQGAHTIGAPDGGPGLPLANWNLAHGDLRAAHFLGLHALQLLPIFVWLLARAGVASRARTRLTIVAGVSWFALVALLVLEALRGEPLLAPAAGTRIALTAWAITTAAALFVAAARNAPRMEVSP